MWTTRTNSYCYLIADTDLEKMLKSSFHLPLYIAVIMMLRFLDDTLVVFCSFCVDCVPVMNYKIRKAYQSR